MPDYEVLDQVRELLTSTDNDQERQRIINEMLETATREQNHLTLAQIHLGVGYHLFDLARYRSAELHFRSALQQARVAADKRLTSSALLALAASLGQQGHLEKAISVTEEARHWLQRSQQWDKVPVTFHNLGEFYLRIGNLDKAIVNFEQAIQTGKMVKRIDIVIDSTSMLSKSRFLKGQHELALEEMKQAISFADEYGDGHEQAITRAQYLDILLRMDVDLKVAAHVAEELESRLMQQATMNFDLLMIVCLFYIQQDDIPRARHWFQILDSAISTRMNELSEAMKLKAKRVKARLILSDCETIPSLEQRRMKALELYREIIQKINENTIYDEDVPVFLLEYAELLLELEKLEECIEYLQQVEIIASQRTQPRTFIHALLLQALVHILLGEKDQADYLKKRATEIMTHYGLDYLKPTMDNVFAQTEAIEESTRINVRSDEKGLYSKEHVDFVQSYLQEVINEFPNL